MVHLARAQIIASVRGPDHMRTPVANSGQVMHADLPFMAFRPFLGHPSPSQTRCLIGRDNPLTLWAIGMCLPEPRSPVGDTSRPHTRASTETLPCARRRRRRKGWDLALN